MSKVFRKKFLLLGNATDHNLYAKAGITSWNHNCLKASMCTHRLLKSLVKQPEQEQASSAHQLQWKQQTHAGQSGFLLIKAIPLSFLGTQINVCPDLNPFQKMMFHNLKQNWKWKEWIRFIRYLLLLPVWIIDCQTY